MKKNVMYFRSNFDQKCKGTCEGWKTNGSYHTEIKGDGNHVLHMTVKIMAPFSLEKSKLKQTWSISASDDGKTTSELFSCKYDGDKGLPKDIKSYDFLSGITSKPLLDWHEEPFGDFL